MLHSSLMRLQKIDMMHSLLPPHRKRLHCILDVSQISLRLTLLFLYVSTLIFARVAAVLANKAPAKLLNQATGVILVILGAAIIAVQYVF